MSAKSEPLKVAVVGAGIGRLHIEGYQKTGRAEVVALCDANPERAQSVAAELGIPKTYTDYSEMLNGETLDAVSVCVPNALHADVAVAAMKSGAAVLCEKPMADTLANAERIAKAAQEIGVPFMMGYNNRFRSESQAIRKAVESGDMGRIYYAKCGWVRRHGIPGMGGWFTRKAMSGGGPMMDIGVHAMDLTMWLMGSPKPVSVCGASYAEFGPRGRGAGGWGTREEAGAPVDVEDLSAGFIRFEDGATLVVEASWAQFVPEDRLYASIYGTEGGADVSPFRFYKDDENGEVADYTPEVAPVHGHHAEVAYFVDCLLSGRTPDGTAEQGLTVMRVIDAIYRSAQSGEEVRL